MGVDGDVTYILAWSKGSPQRYDRTSYSGASARRVSKTEHVMGPVRGPGGKLRRRM